MKLFQAAKNAAGVFVVTSVAAGSAMAALDTGITTAISDGKADVLAMGALVIGVLVAVAALKWLRKAL